MKSKRSHEPLEDFQEQVNAKSKRKLKTRRFGNHTVWFGLGMFGIIGWSIAIPTFCRYSFGSLD